MSQLSLLKFWGGSSGMTVRQYELGRGPVKQGFYQCNWDVLSVCSDESDDESDECCSLADSEDQEDVLHIPAD